MLLRIAVQIKWTGGEKALASDWESHIATIPFPYCGKFDVDFGARYVAYVIACLDAILLRHQLNSGVILSTTAFGLLTLRSGLGNSLLARYTSGVLRPACVPCLSEKS